MNRTLQIGCGLAAVLALSGCGRGGQSAATTTAPGTNAASASGISPNDAGSGVSPTDSSHSVGAGASGAQGGSAGGSGSTGGGGAH